MRREEVKKKKGKNDVFFFFFKVKKGVCGLPLLAEFQLKHFKEKIF